MSYIKVRFKTCLFCLLISSCAIAEEKEVITLNWSNSYDTISKEASTSIWTPKSYFVVTAYITLSGTGEQKLYFKVNNGKGSTWFNTCSKVDFTRLSSEIFYKQQVWRINNQNIKMSVYCNKRLNQDDSEFWQLQGTPLSSKGQNFIVDSFIKAPKTVSIRNGEFDINISSIGFTKSWNSFGGDAL